MPAVNLATLPTIPYVYSATTTATTNKCQIITIPAGGLGLNVTIHNRDKASKNLRISFASDLTQDGTAPSVFFTVGEPLLIALGPNAATGFPAPTQLVLFSDSASVNYELLFRP
jgi:hypothetical protein